ncbi:MAG: hypothetical protein HQP61_04895 [Peptococcaceae bacterium]|nr:hypothetical protein [Candidatus Syntrophopropionicum ammoniitolerans]
MELINIGLALFSIGLFMATFFYCTKTPQTAKAIEEKPIAATEIVTCGKDEQEKITIQLPGKILGDNQYTLDLKVCYIKNEKKKPCYRLDEFI